MRQYEPIWNKLKSLPRKEAETKGVSLTAPRPLHGRIIKAVKKEKWMDLGFKLTIEPRESTLFHARKNSVLTFFLSYTQIEEDF